MTLSTNLAATADNAVVTASKLNVTCNTAGINNVGSFPKHEAAMILYDRADITADPLVMDSGATDHMTPGACVLFLISPTRT